MPLLVRWPAEVQPGVSDALVCQVDFLASFASFTDQALAEKDAPDSFDVMDALLGREATGRATLVEHARALALRSENWKYVEGLRGEKRFSNTNIESGLAPGGQLYDLSNDLGEQNNVIDEHPDLAADLAQQLNEIKAAGRSRP